MSRPSVLTPAERAEVREIAITRMLLPPVKVLARRYGVSEAVIAHAAAEARRAWRNQKRVR